MHPARVEFDKSSRGIQNGDNTYRQPRYPDLVALLDGTPRFWWGWWSARSVYGNALMEAKREANSKVVRRALGSS